MNESEFIASYDKSQFDSPIISVDTVLFTYHDDLLKVLLVKRSNHPDKGKWGLPGGFVALKQDHDLTDTALRKLKEKTGVIPPYLEQLASYGNTHRDKRGWSVTICYTALVAYSICKATVNSVSDVKWVELEKLNNLQIAFDHLPIINDARERLRQKALYSLVPAYALPEEFTLPQLQQLHEVLIGKTLQKKSFRRRIEQADLLVQCGERRSERGRPATLYRMKDNLSSFNFVRNLES
jgi:8-oxo-dGTP diphosphatase